MTQADLERRIRELEQKVFVLEKDLVAQGRALAVLSTGITIARWLGPFIVSVATVVIVVAKGG